MMGTYNEKFFETQQEGSRRSAEVIVPLVLQLVPAKSVVDVGCGLGTWLSVFMESGITDVLGLDGDYVETRLLRIPTNKFLAADLEKPFPVEREFDLVTCLEVGEHLPAESAEGLVKSLVKLGPVVLFSAAIPFQGGFHHVNEQWPDYWQQLFLDEGYVAIDALRKHIWQNCDAQAWYRQNILLYVKQDHLGTCETLQNELNHSNLNQLVLVHPEIYLRQCTRTPALREVLKMLPIAIKGAIERKSNRIFLRSGS